MREVKPRIAIGCATVATTPGPALRRCILEMAAQVVPPLHHVVCIESITTGSSPLSDLEGEMLSVRKLPSGATLTEAYLYALQALYDLDVEMFFCIDPAHIYRRNYISQFLAHPAITNEDLWKRAACLNLINQEWTAVTQDNETGVFPFHFRQGLGLSSEEQAIGQRVGAPGTFALTRQAAALLLATDSIPNEYRALPYDIAFRRTLMAHGVNIDLLDSPHPVFVYGAPPSEPFAGRNAPPAESSVPPDVSIVIPTYNEGDWLRKTIESIARAKTKATWEIIVIDDGCTDGSKIGRAHV